jgi:hypothetical protein
MRGGWPHGKDFGEFTEEFTVASIKKHSKCCAETAFYPWNEFLRWKLVQKSDYLGWSWFEVDAKLEINLFLGKKRPTTFMNKRISGNVNVSNPRSIFFWVKRSHVLTAFSDSLFDFARFQIGQQFNIFAVGGWFDLLFDRGPFVNGFEEISGRASGNAFPYFVTRRSPQKRHNAIVRMAIVNE